MVRLPLPTLGPTVALTPPTTQLQIPLSLKAASLQRHPSSPTPLPVATTFNSGLLEPKTSQSNAATPTLPMSTPTHTLTFKLSVHLVPSKALEMLGTACSPST